MAAAWHIVVKVNNSFSAKMEIPSLLQICISSDPWGLWGPEVHRNHVYETPVWGTVFGIYKL